MVNVMVMSRQFQGEIPYFLEDTKTLSPVYVRAK